MPASKTKKTKDQEREIEFLKSGVDKILQINQQIDLGIYPKLGIATIVFILSLFNVLSVNQRGVIGFMVIAAGSVTASLLAVYSFKQTVNGRGYESIIFNGLLAPSRGAEKFRSNLEELLSDNNNLIEFYKRQLVTLTQLARSKRALQEYSLYALTMSYLIGIILIIALP